MTWMLITCGKCGHEANIDDFTRTEVFGELPRDQYQCPQCRTAFKREPQGKPHVSMSGFVIPAPMKIVQIEGRL